MGLLTALTAAPLRTVRPKMLRDVYADPEKELVRLTRAGYLTKLAPGTYVAKPDNIDPQTPWRPPFEEAAMAVATTIYGPRVPVLFGIAAARFHHAIPRAIGAAVVAVPRQHRPIAMAGGGRLVLTTTDVERLDARLEHGALGAFLVTTPEQTLLDLLARPELGGMPAEARAAVRALIPLVDLERLAGLVEGRSAKFQGFVRRLIA